MKNIILLSTLFTIATIMVSCDATNGDPISTDDDNAFQKALADAYAKGDRSLDYAPIELQEFVMNYQLLDLFYINAHTMHELDKPDAYYGKAEGTLFGTLPFGDVYYMFNQMSCLFTNYFDPSRYEQMAKMLYYSDEGSGFGMDYDTLNNTGTLMAVVANVYLNGPAYKAGIMEGDTLLTINGVEAILENVTSTEEKLPKNGEAAITLKRGADVIDVSVTKQEFISPSVYVNYIKDIPVITITGFVDTTTLLTGTYGEFKEALKRTEGAKATIINLADNGGGSVDHCMPMAAELLPRHTVLGYTIETNIDSSRGDYRQKIDTTVTMPEDYGMTEDGIAMDRYIVFVQDGGTASCSELMISAVAASKNTPVVGTQSYGKGIGQYYFETIAGGFSGVTSSKFFDKRMKSYHSYGIEPDFVVKGTKASLLKAYEIASEGTYVRTAEYSSKPSGNFAMALKRTQPEANIRESFGAFKVKKAPKFHK